MWESEQACACAFEERVHPAVDTAFGGQRPPGEPAVEHLEIIDAKGPLVPADVVADLDSRARARRETA